MRSTTNKPPTHVALSPTPHSKTLYCSQWNTQLLHFRRLLEYHTAQGGFLEIAQSAPDRNAERRQNAQGNGREQRRRSRSSAYGGTEFSGSEGYRGGSQ